jgi:DNA mismatch repair protein MutL
LPAARFSRGRRGPASRNHHRRRRSLLQHSGAAQISPRRIHRTGPRHRAGHALRAGPPGEALRAVSASHTIVSAPPVARTAERIYQIFGKDTLANCCPWPPNAPSPACGLPEPPPWKKDPDEPARDPGSLRLTGFYSKPELQKLNRNSIYIFVNKRLIRDRLLLHAITEAYRNVIPPTSFPVVLLFLEMPPEEVDVNVHPAKTEVRFRQQSLVHDFVRDSLRTALIKARPAAGFLAALDSQPSASPSLMPPAASPLPGHLTRRVHPFPCRLTPIRPPPGRRRAVPADPALPTPVPGKLPFERSFDERNLAGQGLPDGRFVRGLDSQAWGAAADALFSAGAASTAGDCSPNPNGAAAYANDSGGGSDRPGRGRAGRRHSLNHLGSLKPLGQLRESFILAAGDDGLWIIDQHVAHERVLFEKILRDRQVEKVQRQRLLMPMLVELKPWQMVVFARIAEELETQRF